MSRPRNWLTLRRSSVGVALVAIVVVTYLAVRSYSSHIMLRHEAADNAQRRELNRDYEAKLSGEIERLVQSQSGGPDGDESVDRIFETLRYSRVANNSREVESWARAPHSPQRRSIALKWARVAADEAAYYAALCERWAVDYGHGRTPHHIMDDEVPPFRMPAGWTEDDLKYQQAKRIE